MEIAVCVPFSQQQLARLERGAGGLAVNVLAEDAACECEIVFGNPEASVVSDNQKLRWMQLESVGFGEYAGLDWTRPQGRVAVTNLAGFFAHPVAETALAGILALYRGIDSLVRFQSERHWVGDPLRTRLRSLRGASVVLVGFGAINRRLVELLAPFGCSISTITRGSPPSSLDSVLALADLVVCTAPDTAETRGLFDAARLARMPASAVFCNFGRGSIVDEDALASALDAGRLSGAVIDVTRQEPLSANHPFWTTPNLILTQHSGGGTADELDRKIDLFHANLARFRAGTPLEGVVDFSRGY